MASETTTTTDHDEIRRWVEEHDGTPASVRGTERSDEAGVRRIDFPGGAGTDELEPISWEEWFEKFEAEKLAFLYQEQGERRGQYLLQARQPLRPRARPPRCRARAPG